MNYNKEAKSLTFRRGAEVSQEKLRSEGEGLGSAARDADSTVTQTPGRIQKVDPSIGVPIKYPQSIGPQIRGSTLQILPGVWVKNRFKAV